MSVNALVNELICSWGKAKQTDAVTANVLAGIWRLNKLNAQMAVPNFATEDDAAEIGNGHEFATATYKSAVSASGSAEKYLSSQIMAWAAAFGLGNVVKSGTGPYTYTCTPLNKVTSGLELPYFSWLEAIRQGGSPIWDKMFVGCALNSFQVQVSKAPGRSSSRITFDWLGTGQITDPSGITHPAKTTETELPGASLALTALTVDYVTLKDIESLTWGWSNNLSLDYYPGAGLVDGYAKAGRIFVGNRTPSLSFVVKAHSASDEYTKLKNLTTGTVVITQTYSADETYTATFHQVAFRAVEVGESGGIVTFSVTCSPQYHSSNGVLSVVAKTAVNGICE